MANIYELLNFIVTNLGYESQLLVLLSFSPRIRSSQNRSQALNSYSVKAIKSFVHGTLRTSSSELFLRNRPLGTKGTEGLWYDRYKICVAHTNDQNVEWNCFWQYISSPLVTAMSREVAVCSRLVFTVVPASPPNFRCRDELNVQYNFAAIAGLVCTKRASAR